MTELGVFLAWLLGLIGLVGVVVAELLDWVRSERHGDD